jgi:translation initiation factor 3 subunit D
MNLNLSNGWAIVRTVVDLIRSAKDEEEDEEDEEQRPQQQANKVRKFVLVKDPNKPVIRLYSVPPNTFEEEDETGTDVKDEEKAEEAEE